MEGKIANFVFVHDRNIRDLFIQESEKCNSNVLKHCKFVCARVPHVTDFEEGEVISAYEDKYKELNGMIRLNTGVMYLLEHEELLRDYEYIGFQRCSIIQSFPNIDNLQTFNKDKIYFMSYKKDISRLDFMKTWGGCWVQTMPKISSIFKYLEQKKGIDAELKKYICWFNNDRNEKFWYNLVMFMHRQKLDVVRKMYEITMSIWNKFIRELNLIVDDVGIDKSFTQSINYNLDIYDSIQEYVYCTYVGMDNIDVGSMKKIFEFCDNNYHCRKR